MNGMYRSLAEIREGLINHLSLLFEDAGHSPLVGKIFALLMFAPEPLSLQEIADMLGVSKAAVSVQIRNMGRNELCHKLHKGNDRKDYYFISDAVSLKVIQAVSRKLLAGQQVISATLEAINSLQALEPQEQASRDIVEKRMSDMSAMYALSMSWLEGLATEWEQRIRRGM